MFLRIRRGRHFRKGRASHTAGGFSLLEAVMSMFVLTVALVGLAAFMAVAVVTTKDAQREMLARQKSREILESIFTSRNTQQITFEMIRNFADGGIFLDDSQDLREPGNDGLVGTADDGPIESLKLPGPDNLLGTADDIDQPLSEFSRRIQITPVLRPDNTVNPDVRRVTVQVSYRLGITRTYQVESLVSRFR